MARVYAITAAGVREIAMQAIIEAGADWSRDNEANARNAFYIAGIAMLCDAICEALERKKEG